MRMILVAQSPAKKAGLTPKTSLPEITMFEANTNTGDLGLTVDEQTSVKAARAKLPHGWHIVLESTDDHDIYARVVPPWNANVSAFLIDRERHGVVLTDNISKDIGPMISLVCNIHDAIEHIAAVVSGARTRDPQAVRVGNHTALDGSPIRMIISAP
jgi:hypothetical protein